MESAFVNSVLKHVAHSKALSGFILLTGSLYLCWIFARAIRIGKAPIAWPVYRDEQPKLFWAGQFVLAIVTLGLFIGSCIVILNVELGQ
jgi:hypothetical protein